MKKNRPVKDDIRGRFAAALTELRQRQKFSGGLFVGFSGGLDSTALLLLCRELLPDLTAVHLHHGLRAGEADRDAAWCEAFCRARSIDFRCHRLYVSERTRPRESMEMAARRCRLEFWQEHCTENGAVALGHHFDDLLETALLRLTRGANVSGIAALRPDVNVAGVRFIRPLLDFRKAELEDFLAAENVHEWCEDSSNLDLEIQRNAVRNVWLPAIRQNCGTDLGLAESIACLQDDADFMEQTATAVFHDGTDFATLHPALLPRVLRLWLREKLHHDVIPSRAAVERLRAALTKPAARARIIPLGKGLNLQVDCNGMRVQEKKNALPTRAWDWRRQPVVELPECGSRLSAEIIPAATAKLKNVHCNRESFAVAEVPEELLIRRRRPGDRMLVFGSKTPRKVQDLLMNAKIPASDRDQVPLVLAGTQIIWIPGVCRGEFGRLNPRDAGSVLRLTYS